jgi:hypothetical protein
MIRWPAFLTTRQALLQSTAAAIASLILSWSSAYTKIPPRACKPEFCRNFPAHHARFIFLSEMATNAAIRARNILIVFHIILAALPNRKLQASRCEQPGFSGDAPEPPLFSSQMN